MKIFIYLALFVSIISGIQEKIYLNAKANVDETVWALNVKRQAKRNEEVVVTAGEYKCNLFVYEIILASGYDIGTPNRANCLRHPILCLEGKDKRPPLCKDWYDNTVSGFDFIGEGKDGLEKSIAGDIITNGSHMGIFVGNKKSISAGADKIIEGDWGFRGDEGNIRVFRCNKLD